MKIIVFGANGMLGKYVWTYLNSINKHVIPITRSQCDANDCSNDKLNILFATLNIQKDDVIINCIGIIPQSGNISNRNYYTVNSIFPILLSHICSQMNVNFIHITTDCVFSGLKGGYTEKDIHDETNNYGVSKSLGEICNATIIRTSIIGEESRKYSFLEWVRSNENGKINGYTNHYWNGITCLELAKIINEIIDKKMYWIGVKHIFTPKIYSKYDMAVIINEVYNLNIEIIEYTSQCVNKSLSTIFNESLFNIPDLHHQIMQMRNFNLKI
jgi:dTDP-4-dehydrorhamnose reductase